MEKRFLEEGRLRIFIYHDEETFRALSEGRRRKMGGSFRDVLTGLFSRAYFDAELERLNTTRQLPLSVVIADVNKFKLVNDVLGHAVGDRILQNVAQRLKTICRREDLVARFGGDEFAILLPKTAREKAHELLMRFPLFFFPFEHDCHIPVSLSFGVATKSEPYQSINEVREEAERAMYHDKTMRKKEVEKQVLVALKGCLRKKVYACEPHFRTSERLRLGLEFGNKLSLTKFEREKLLRLLVFHDLGKIIIPGELLSRDRKEMSVNEWKLITSHSEAGYRLASQLQMLNSIAEEILSFRERWDGKGYPRGLRGRAIPFLSRAGAIMNAYEAMTMGRPYRLPLSRLQAMEEIWNQRGKQFDPEIAPLFLKILEVKEFSSKGS
ncbi:MAG: diguanylate cyclase [Atribacterota bacterium]